MSLIDAARAGEVTYVAAAGAPPCESCRLRPAEVLVLADGEGFALCVECAADGIRTRRARLTKAVPQ